MKLVFAIIHDDDAPEVMGVLSQKGYFVTKLASTGGFLRSGNTTLISGVDDGQVEEIIQIFEDKCKARIQTMVVSNPYGSIDGYMPSPIDVKVGGATVFVLDVEQFGKF